MLAIQLILRATLICKLGNTFYFRLSKGAQGKRVEGEVLVSVAFRFLSASTRRTGLALRP